MAGIGGISGASQFGANPLGGMAGANAGGIGGQSLSGFGDLGLGDNGSGGGNDSTANLGIGPTNQATKAQGASFGDTLRAMVVENPSASKAEASALATRFASGDKTVDAHTLAITSAKAGVEIQMATRTISSAVSAVRTLFQMQI